MNIKEQRLKAGISQAKLSKLVGVSRNAVQNWESTGSKPSVENMIKLKAIFGL